MVRPMTKTTTASLSHAVSAPFGDPLAEPKLDDVFEP